MATDHGESAPDPREWVSRDEANRVLAEERTEHGHTMRRLGLLADALGKVLVASGMVYDQSMTGPDLLHHADTLAECLSASGRRRE